MSSNNQYYVLKYDEISNARVNENIAKEVMERVMVLMGVKNLTSLTIWKA